MHIVINNRTDISNIIPCPRALYWMGSIQLDTEDAFRVAQGVSVETDSSEGLYNIFHGDRFLGIAESSNSMLKPCRLLPQEEVIGEK